MIKYNQGTAEQSLRHRLFKIAAYKGYCNIYSSYDVTMSAIQRVVDEMNLTNMHSTEEIDYVEKRRKSPA